MEILMVAVIAASNIACFVIGAKIGQKSAKGEEISVIPEPLAAAKHSRESKEAQLKRERMEAILKNIDIYDGSAAHQQDIPRG